MPTSSSTFDGACGGGEGAEACVRVVNAAKGLADVCIQQPAALKDVHLTDVSSVSNGNLTSA